MTFIDTIGKSICYCVILYSSNLPRQLVETMEQIDNENVKFVVLNLNDGKRDHPRDYWVKFLFPKMFGLFSEEFLPEKKKLLNINFYYESNEINQYEACAVLCIAILYHVNSPHSSPPKTEFKELLSKVQTSYTDLNPPRRYMKELSNYFCSI